MTRHHIAIAAHAALPALVAAQSPIQVARLTLSPSSKVAELDLDKLKGQPSRLAWSADGTQVYVQTMEGAFGQPGQKFHHYTVSLADGKREELQGEPDWASAYWTVKADRQSPDAAMKIELKQEVRTEKTTSSPMGGDLARGGVGGDTGTGAAEALAAANNQQTIPVITLMVRDAIIGQFVNTVLVPGMTFGWGPKGSNVVAFADHKNGRVVVMDDRGEKREIPGSKDASFPAWSADGTRIAWLQKDGKKKYVLQTARVEPAS